MNQLFYKLLPLGRRLPGPLRGLLGRGYRAYQRASRGRRVVATVDGITYLLDLGEYIDSSIYFGGCFEPDTTAAIQRLCRPGMTVVDVEANVGCHALRFAGWSATRGASSPSSPWPGPAPNSCATSS